MRGFLNTIKIDIKSALCLFLIKDLPGLCAKTPLGYGKVWPQINNPSLVGSYSCAVEERELETFIRNPDFVTGKLPRTSNRKGLKPTLSDEKYHPSQYFFPLYLPNGVCGIFWTFLNWSCNEIIYKFWKLCSTVLGCFGFIRKCVKVFCHPDLTNFLAPNIHCLLYKKVAVIWLDCFKLLLWHQFW